jgi:hypothetical protein
VLGRKEPQHAAPGIGARVRVLFELAVELEAKRARIRARLAELDGASAQRAS